ncbi:MAG: TatD family hydrolase [Candidatus Omnitrophota bacterium]
MKLIDTHCHLDFPDYKDDLDAVLDRARDKGVARVIVPASSLENSINAVKLAKKYSFIFAGVGIHPHDADKVSDKDIAVLRDLAVTEDKIIAIGEIGLDYFKGYSKKENQKKLFKKSLLLAKTLDLPIIFHNRDADEDFLDVLKENMPPPVKGVMHCFSADEVFLRKALTLGLHISFTGNITFKKASNLRDLIKHVPLERLLLETDSPFLAPGIFRGKRNEPAYITELLPVYKEAYDLEPEKTAEITTRNADQLFGLGIEKNGKIVYEIRDSLYLNITNRCTNRCTFCVRQHSNYVSGYDLKLSAEPTVEEIISSLGDVSKYKEIVFCGYGEPTLRLGAIKKISAYIKEKGGKVRLTTNGEGSLIAGRDIVSEIKDLVDRVSVSLNAPSADIFDKLCLPVFGQDTHGAVLSFIKECRAGGITVEITCLDIIGVQAVAGCRAIAKELGAEFRLRQLDVVG